MLYKIKIFTEKMLCVIKETDKPYEVLLGIANALGKDLEASVMVLNDEGKVLGLYNNDAFQIDIFLKENGRFVDGLLMEQLRNFTDADVSLTLSKLFIKTSTKSVLDKYNCLAMPIMASFKKMGSMLIYREGETFNEEEKIICKTALGFISLSLAFGSNEESLQNQRDSSSVKGAIDTLSYSELSAALHIFEELGGHEGLIVASKVADRVGITRSVIVTGLRKLESAGLIESRSLGMKGTYIKVLNNNLIIEIDKLRR